MSISDVSSAETWLREECAKLGLQEDVKIVSVTNRWRWMLDFEQSKDHPEFTVHMIRLEKALQDRLKRPIDLRLEPMADKNLRVKRNVLATGNYINKK